MHIRNYGRKPGMCIYLVLADALHMYRGCVTGNTITSSPQGACLYWAKNFELSVS